MNNEHFDLIKKNSVEFFTYFLSEFQNECEYDFSMTSDCQKEHILTMIQKNEKFINSEGDFCEDVYNFIFYYLVNSLIISEDKTKLSDCFDYKFCISVIDHTKQIFEQIKEDGKFLYEYSKFLKYYMCTNTSGLQINENIKKNMTESQIDTINNIMKNISTDAFDYLLPLMKLAIITSHKPKDDLYYIELFKLPESTKHLAQLNKEIFEYHSKKHTNLPTIQETELSNRCKHIIFSTLNSHYNNAKDNFDKSLSSAIYDFCNNYHFSVTDKDSKGSPLHIKRKILRGYSFLKTLSNVVKIAYFESKDYFGSKPYHPEIITDYFTGISETPNNVIKYFSLYAFNDLTAYINICLSKGPIYSQKCGVCSSNCRSCPLSSKSQCYYKINGLGTKYYLSKNNLRIDNREAFIFNNLISAMVDYYFSVDTQKNKLHDYKVPSIYNDLFNEVASNIRNQSVTIADVIKYLGYVYKRKKTCTFKISTKREYGRLRLQH